MRKEYPEYDVRVTILGYLPFLFVMGRAGAGPLRGGGGKHRSRYTLGNR